MYKALITFTDLQDNNYKYHPGDEFPRNGLEVTEGRIKELLSSNNRRNKPVIAEEKPKEKPEAEKKVKKNVKRASKGTK